MKIKIFGLPIYISFLLMAVITLLLFIDDIGIVSAFLLAVFIHELGHLVVILFLKLPVTGIKITIRELGIEVEACKICTFQYMLLNISGCAANLLVAILFWFILGWKYQAFIFACVALAAANLLPIKGNDGGAVLELVLETAFGVVPGQKIFSIISSMMLFLTCIGMIFIGITLKQYCFFLISVLVLAIKALSAKVE